MSQAPCLQGHLANAARVSNSVACNGVADFRTDIVQHETDAFCSNAAFLRWQKGFVYDILQYIVTGK